MILLEEKIKTALAIMSEAQKVYDTWLGHEFTYVYKQKNGTFEELKFLPMKKNFLHLCGVICKKGSKPIAANEFYNLLSSNKIHPSMISFKTDGTTELKLSAFKHMSLVMTCKMRVIGERITLLRADYDMSIRSSKVLLVLGLVYENGSYRPKSLLDGKTLKSIPAGSEVHCIYSRNLNTKKITLCDCREDFRTTKTYQDIFSQ